MYTLNHPADAVEGKGLGRFGENSRLVADIVRRYAVVVVSEDGVSAVGPP